MKHDPKTILTAFMDAWVEKNYERMYELAQITWCDNYSLEYFKQHYGSLEVYSYRILEGPIQQGCCIADFKLRIKTKTPVLPHKIRLIHEEAPYRPSSPRGWFRIKGRWGVNPQTLNGLFRVDLKEQEKRERKRNFAKNAKKGKKKRVFRKLQKSGTPPHSTNSTKVK